MSRQTTHQGTASPINQSPASPLHSNKGSAVPQLSDLGAATPELFSQSTATPSLLNPSTTQPQMSNQSEATLQLFDQGAATPCLFSQSTAVPQECKPSATTAQLFDQGAATPSLFNQGPAKHQTCFPNTDTPLTSTQLPGAQTSTLTSGYATWSTRGYEDWKRGLIYSPEQAYLNFIVPDDDEEEDGSHVIAYDRYTEDKRDDDFVNNTLSINREGGDHALSHGSSDDESDESTDDDRSSDYSSSHESSSEESSDDNGITLEDLLSSDDEEDKIARPNCYPLPLRYRKQCPTCGRIPTRSVRRQRYKALKCYRDNILSGRNLDHFELSMIRQTPVKYQFFSACQYAVGSVLCKTCKFPKPTSPLCAPDPPTPLPTQPSAKSRSKRSAKLRFPLQRQVTPRAKFSSERIAVLVREYKKANSAHIIANTTRDSGDQHNLGSYHDEQETHACSQQSNPDPLPEQSGFLGSDILAHQGSGSMGRAITGRPEQSKGINQASQPQPGCSDQQEQGSRGRNLQRRVPFSRRELQAFDLSEDYSSPERPTAPRRSYQRQRPVSRTPRNNDDASRSTERPTTTSYLQRPRPIRSRQRTTEL